MTIHNGVSVWNIRLQPTETVLWIRSCLVCSACSRDAPCLRTLAVRVGRKPKARWALDGGGLERCGFDGTPPVREHGSRWLSMAEVVPLHKHPPHPPPPRSDSDLLLFSLSDEGQVWVGPVLLYVWTVRGLLSLCWVWMSWGCFPGALSHSLHVECVCAGIFHLLHICMGLCMNLWTQMCLLEVYKHADVCMHGFARGSDALLECVDMCASSMSVYVCVCVCAFGWFCVL